MFNSISKPFVLLMTMIIVAPISAQQVHSYKTVPRTIYEKKPVKVTKWVDETVMEKQTVTSYKKVWQTETRERHRTEYKPVQKTSEREERTVVRKPIVETRFRKQETTHTTYETVTEMRDETYTVRKPIVETQMRDETVVVRKPVTEQLVEVQRTTSYKPVWKNSTNYVQQDTIVQQLSTVADPSRRPRMQWLEAGYYTDPVTGYTIYRRRGFHWVAPLTVTPVASIVPTLIPQESSELSYVPETTETRKPVEVTRFVEQTETRRVPIEIQRTIEQVETRKVPVTVRIPKTTVVVEEIPYTETTYKDEVIVKKVPYTETTYEKVETVEPYTVEVPRWIPETKEVEVPRTVQKRVEYEVLQDIPRTVLFRIPLDDCGNEIGPAVPVESEADISPSLSNENISTSSSTTARRIPATETAKSVLTTKPELTETSGRGYQGELNLVQPKTLDETSARKSVVEVPDTSAAGSRTELGDIPRPAGTQSETAEEKTPGQVDPPAQPEVEPSESGDEQAAERPPVPRESKSGTPADGPRSNDNKPATDGDKGKDESDSDETQTAQRKSVVA